MKNQNGQSLLEIVVTMGLGLIVITGIAVVTVNGLKNSQLAKNQAVATQLAQEGLEKVRSIKSQNCPVQNGSSTYYWQNNPAASLVYSNFATAVDFVISTTAPATPTTPCLTVATATSVDPDIASFPNFNRNIELVNLDCASCGTPVVRVSSIVTWSDYSGDHESRIATTFSQRQN